MFSFSNKAPLATFVRRFYVHTRNENNLPTVSPNILWRRKYIQCPENGRASGKLVFKNIRSFRSLGHPHEFETSAAFRRYEMLHAGYV